MLRAALCIQQMRERHRIADGQTVVVVDDAFGLRICTRDEIMAEAQAYFADLAPLDVLPSGEILQDRSAEHERD